MIKSKLAINQNIIARPPIKKMPLKPLSLNLSARTRLFNGDNATIQVHTDFHRKALEHWQEMMSALSTVVENGERPDVVFIDAKKHLKEVQKVLELILYDFAKKQEQAKKELNRLHSSAAEQIKKSSTSPEATEVRQYISRMTKEKRDSLLNQPAKLKPTIVWAAMVAEQASLFLSPEQQNIARSKVLISQHENFEHLTLVEEIASAEITSIKKQLNEASRYIADGVNQLKTKYPNEFQNLN